MEAKELRIGNLVLINGKVIKMDLKMFHAVLMGLEGYEPEPIPLTEERLIKLGLKKMPETEYTCDTYDLVGFKLWMHKGKFLFGDIMINIEHVHQLQNLSYDLGKEITMKL